MCRHKVVDSESVVENVECIEVSIQSLKCTWSVCTASELGSQIPLQVLGVSLFGMWVN